MESKKLEISGRQSPNNEPPASYKPLPETDMEEDAVPRPKSIVKSTSNSPERDGADERMLPKEETAVTPNSKIDEADVKISMNEKQNGDAKLDIEDLKNCFVGLGKEELMKYANDPFWVRLRWFLFILFWLLWAAMLVGAILIIYAAPKCDPPPPRTWWEKGPLTELDSKVEPESLKLVKDKGFEGVIIKWPEDTYHEVNDTHHMVKLLQQAKQDEINIVVDLEPAFSSVWFERSEGGDLEFSDYYIWRAPKSMENGEPKPPNNWLTPKNQSSWKFSSKRNQYYYAPLDKPHLNFRNKNVTLEFSNVIQRFIEKGAAGVRLRNAPQLLVDSLFDDEPINPMAPDRGFLFTDYGFYLHKKTEHLSDLGPLLKEWRKIVKNMTENGLFAVAEELSNIEAYKVNTSLVVDLPLQTRVFSKTVFNVFEVATHLNNTFNVDGLNWPLWKANTSAVPKDVMDIVTYLLPGAPLIQKTEKINAPLMKIRNTPSIMRGMCSVHSVGNDSVLAYIRVTPGNPGILVAVNPTNEKAHVNLPKEVPALSEIQEVTVLLYSGNYNETNWNINGKNEATNVPISAKSALVLSYVPKKKED